MGFSAIGRRWIGRSESSAILRQICVADVVNSGYSNSSANRKMSTGSVTSLEHPAPLLMLPPAVDGRGNIVYTFHSLANTEVPPLENNIGGGGGGLRLPSDLIKDVKFVGSTHGWLALYNRRNHDLFLSNPITDRHIKIGSAPRVDRIVLSSDPVEDEASCLAFKLGGDGGRLVFCSPRSSGVFGSANLIYDNLVYSTAHQRLFCVGTVSSNSIDSLILESWDPIPVPRLDWTIKAPDSDVVINNSFYSNNAGWPYPMARNKLYSQLRYVVCAEHSGELFLVVRYVNLRAGPSGSIVNKVVFANYDGCNFIKFPYKTVGFDVYKVDLEGRRVVRMEDSLEGMAIFVGINHPLAIPATDAVKPDCVYFTDENGLVEATRLERTNYGGHDNGIFDYRNKEMSPCCELYPVEYGKIRKSLPLPLWFVPTTTSGH